MSLKKTIFMAAAMAALAGMGNDFYSGKRHSEGKPYPKPASLPRWRVGEHILFAKNAADAEKYARKRGLWKEGCTVEPINEQ